MSTPTRPSLSSFWHDLPRDGKLLLSTVAIETLGTGLVLPFGVIYLHEVRHFPVETAGMLLAVPAVVGMAVVGPAGSLIDRLGARRIILAGMTAQMVGNVLLAFAGTVWMAALAFALLGAAGGVFWPGFNAMIGAVVPSAIRQRYYGVNFTLVNLGIGLGGAARPGSSSTSTGRARSSRSTSATPPASSRRWPCCSARCATSPARSRRRRRRTTTGPACRRRPTSRSCATARCARCCC